MVCAECGDSLPFSGASSILPYHILFPATLLRQLCFHPPSLHPAIYFLVYLLVLLFPNSYTILFWESCFLPFSVQSAIRNTKIPSFVWIQLFLLMMNWRGPKHMEVINKIDEIYWEHCASSLFHLLEYYSVFTVLDSVCCDTDKEGNHVLSGEWLLLLVINNS